MAIYDPDVMTVIVGYNISKIQSKNGKNTF